MMKKLQRLLIVILAVLGFFISIANADESKKPDLVFFKSGNNYIAYDTDGLGEQLCHSSNGKNFYEVFRTGYSGSLDDHRVSFVTRDGQEGSWHYKDGEILVDRVRLGVFESRELFKKVSPPAEVIFVALPEIRIPEYLFRLPNERFIYVSANKYHYSYESFRLFTGKGDNMREIEIKSVRRFRDGGTTEIRTEEGLLYFPSPFKKGNATWDNEKIKRLDPSEYGINDVGDRVQIR